MGALDGRNAIVTGSGRGVGLAVARQLAAEGARVLVNDLDRDVAEEAAASIDGALAFAGGGDARAVEAILPVRSEAVRIGGSHAQRDIVNLTLIAAAERSGQWSLARTLLAERAEIRPTPRTKAQYHRALRRAPH